MESYKKLLNSTIDNLVSNHISNNSFDIKDIDPSDLQALAALCIEEDNREIECITENTNYDDIISSLICLLKKDNSDNRELFIETIQKHLVNYYKPRLTKLMERRAETVISENNWDNGLRMVQYSNGDKEWKRA